VSAHRETIRERDERAASLGYVPRELDVPKAPGSLGKLAALMERRTHGALLRRIRGK
jgi:hypothetical protein